MPWKFMSKEDAMTCPGLAYGTIDWYHWIAQRLAKEGSGAVWKYGCTAAKWEGFMQYIVRCPAHICRLGLTQWVPVLH